MLKKVMKIMLTSLSTLFLGLGAFLGFSHQEAEPTQALGSDRVIYLNAEDGLSFYENVRASFTDGNGGSLSGVTMKKVPGTTRIYRYTIPSDFNYQTVYFYCLDEPGYEIIDAETPNNLTIPTNKNNVYIIDNKKSEMDIHAMIYYAKGDWGYYDGDVPEEGDGYYLVGTKTDWKFKGATKLGNGTKGDKAEILNYQAEANEEFYIRSYFEDEEVIYGEKYVVGDTPKSLNIFVDQEDKQVVDEYVLPPEFEGYYLSGTFSNVDKWAYYDSIKMNAASGKYVAEYRGLEVRQNDQIRVRHFSYDAHPWENWGVISGNQDLTTFGHMEGDNFVFSTSGTYDVFALLENDCLAYLIKEHVDAFTVELTCCYYDGATKVDIEDIPSQTAYADEEFNPVAPDYEYKGFVGVYKDEECKFEYTPKILDTNTHLYLKFLNDNYYCFTGKLVSGVYYKDYVLANGVKMNNQNLEDDSYQAEIYLQAKANEEYMFGLVDKDLDYVLAPTTGAGAQYIFGHVEYSYKTFNYIFHSTGTYHVVITKENHLVFKDAYGEPFINGASSSIEVSEKNRMISSLNQLKKVWSSHKDYFGYVEDRSEFNKIGFKFTENPKTIYEEFINKYYLAINRYGSDELENYIFPDTAKVEPHQYQYKVTFDTMGGELDEKEVLVNENEEITLPTPKRKGYSFVGWSIQGSEDIIASPYVVIDDVTLIAHWTPNKKGCGGFVTTSVSAFAIAVSALVFFIFKKKITE